MIDSETSSDAEGSEINFATQACFAKVSVDNVVQARRFESLVFSYILLGADATIVTSLLLARGQNSIWHSAVIECVTFILCSIAVFSILRKRGKDWQLWFWAVVFVSFIFGWITVFLSRLGDPIEAWLYWPVAVLIGVGSIPWGVRELSIINSVVIVCSVTIISTLHLSIFAISLFFVILFLSLLCSLLVYRRIVERFFFGQFLQNLNRVHHTDDVFYLFVDSVLASISAPFALYRICESEREYGQVGDEWTLCHSGNRVRVKIKDPLFLESSLSNVVNTQEFLIGQIRRLKATFVFKYNSNKFSVSSGIFVRLSPVVESSWNTIIRPHRVKHSVEFFFGVSAGFCALYGRWVNSLLSSIMQMLVLRLALIDAKQDREQDEKYYQATRKQWEYELSSLVHDTNNSVQDLMMLCDGIIEICHEHRMRDHQNNSIEQHSIITDAMESISMRIGRVLTVSRSISTVVSDGKRKRELENLQDLSPREKVIVQDVIQGAIGYAAIKAERRRIKLQTGHILCQQNVDNGQDVPIDQVKVMVSSREHLESIVRNLLCNAVGVSKPGGYVSVSSYERDGWVVLEIIDSGPGMSKDQADKLLSGLPLDGSVSEMSDMLVQGVLHMRRVIESAGGTLSISSAGGILGSMFTIMLPAIHEEMSAAIGAPWALMVDDQPQMTNFYSRIAKALSLEPCIACSVEESMRLLEKRGRPEIVVTDIQLGDTDGLSLVSFLRGSYGKKLPILVVSGQDDVSKRVFDAGATDYVSKPIRRQMLFERIQKLLAGGE